LFRTLYLSIAITPKSKSFFVGSGADWSLFAGIFGIDRFYRRDDRATDKEDSE
jgi:hypothetical protein